MKQYVYSFAEVDPTDVALLGGKGAGLAEMAQDGLPVPPGFIISTDACKDRLANKLDNEVLFGQVEEAMGALQADCGHWFGDDLLISVRSGAAVSMPGMMETVLNLGATSATEAPFVERFGSSRFFLEVWKEFMCQFGKICCGLSTSERLNHPEQMYKSSNGLGHTFTDAEYREMVSLVYSRIARVGYEEALNNPTLQLKMAVLAVLESWNGDKAVAYRNHQGIPHDLGTAVSVVSMVYGNLNEDSGTGVLFSRNPSTGENKIYGEYLVRAQGEAVVSGSVTPEPLSELAIALPKE